MDFALFDTNGDGRVAQDELVVHRIDVDPDPVGPGCATARRPHAVELDGVQLGGGGNLLMVNAGTDTNLITLAHETGHAAFDMPDLYFWNVGNLDLGGPTCQPDGLLFRLSAWQKLHLGWLVPTVVTCDGYYDVPVMVIGLRPACRATRRSQLPFSSRPAREAPRKPPGDAGQVDRPWW